MERGRPGKEVLSVYIDETNIVLIERVLYILETR